MYLGSMTIYEFIVLNEAEKAEAVCNCGVHIGSREAIVHSTMLYQLESFYVEVLYNNANNVITRFRHFSSTDQLEPYIQQIELPILWD